MKKFWKLGNITLGIASNIPQCYLRHIQSRAAFGPIAYERKYLMDIMIFIPKAE